MKSKQFKTLRQDEVRAAAKIAPTMGALCESLGACYGTVRRALDHLGIERRWRPGGRPPGYSVKNVVRNAAICAMRVQDPPLTYQQISDQYGITPERVRQILNASGSSDLGRAATGRLYRHRHATSLVDWTCVNCGKKERRRGQATKSKYCSLKCAGEGKRLPVEESQLIFGPRILELREAGVAYHKIARRLGFRGTSLHSLGGQAQTVLARWAERVGVDISHLKTGRTFSKPQPPASEICDRYTNKKQSASLLAKEYGVRPGLIKKILEQNNIPVRGVAEAACTRRAA